MSDIDPTDDRGSRPRVRLLVGIAAAVLVLGAALAWFLFLRDDSPAAFDIDDDELPAEGETIRVTAPGEMTIKGATSPVPAVLPSQLSAPPLG